MEKEKSEIDKILDKERKRCFDRLNREEIQYAKNPPKSFDEAADRVLAKLLPHDIEIIRYTDISDLIFYEDSIGLLVGNISRLNDKNSPLGKRFRKLRICFPDSSWIIHIIWNRLQQGKDQQLPMKYQKAVKRVLKAVSSEEKIKIKNIPEEDLCIHIDEHIGLVKKHWGLWKDDSLIYRWRYAISLNGIAAQVFREVWKRLQESK